MSVSSHMLNKFSGCFLGLALGDAYGAPFEGGLIERLLWKVIGKTKQGKIRYTDDTQMSMDIANSFIKYKEINQEDLASTFAKSYQWSRGYGPSAANLLKKIKKGAKWQDVNRAKFKEGSFGNGAAMRAPVLAMCFVNDKEGLDKSVVQSSEITHAHPMAIEGAKLIALVSYAALHDWSSKAILEALPRWCTTDEYTNKIAFCIKSLNALNTIGNKVLKSRLGNGIAASDSCVTAIYFALLYREQSHEAMLTHIYSLGGDTDTIGAMAGGIWGAFNGLDLLDKNKIQNLEHSEKIIELSKKLYILSSTKER